MRRQTATTRALSIVEAAPVLGYHRSHVYRLLDPDSIYFDAELAALVHHKPSGSIYFIEDELDTLVRSRCSRIAPAESAA